MRTGVKWSIQNLSDAERVSLSLTSYGLRSELSHLLFLTASDMCIFSIVSSLGTRPPPHSFFLVHFFPPLVPFVGGEHQGSVSTCARRVGQKHSARDIIRECVLCCDEAANHQLPTGEAFWIIQIASLEECSSLTQNLMQIHFATCSVIFNVTATQYTCSLNGIYRPHWLVQ